MWEHGGNIYRAAREWGYNEEEILDFSANINPLGLSPAARHAIISSLDRVVNYPQPGNPELISAIADFLGVRGNYIVPGNGATEIIYLTVRAVNPEKALVVAPTFSEYSRALRCLGCLVDYFTLKEGADFHFDVGSFLDSLSDEYQLLVLCNPNNPTGTLVSSSDMEHIIRAARGMGICVMVDEAFMDFVEEQYKYSMVNAVEEYENLVVVRSLTKFFGMPGLRLGYGVVSSTRLRQAMEGIKEPWSVNILAERAGIAVLEDKEYIRNTRKWLRQEREYIYKRLKSICGLLPFRSYANFVLVKITRPGMDAGLLQRMMLSKRVLIRNAENFQGLDNRFVRIAVKSREANLHL